MLNGEIGQIELKIKLIEVLNRGHVKPHVGGTCCTSVQETKYLMPYVSKLLSSIFSDLGVELPETEIRTSIGSSRAE